MRAIGIGLGTGHGGGEVGMCEPRTHHGGVAAAAAGPCDAAGCAAPAHLCKLHYEGEECVAARMTAA